MARIETAGLTPLQMGRLNAALDKLIRVDGRVTSWRDYIATLTGEKRETDGMANYSRTRYNRMTGREQEAYIRRLEARRVYTLAVPHPSLSNVFMEAPKVIFDAVRPDDDPGEAEAAAAWTDADSVALFGSV